MPDTTSYANQPTGAQTERVMASSEFTCPMQCIGEGASGSLDGQVWPFVRQNQWFTVMMRVWQQAGVANPQEGFRRALGGGCGGKPVASLRHHAAAGGDELAHWKCGVSGGLRARREVGAFAAPADGLLP